MAEDYQYIPTEALDLEQRTDQADQWAAQQRRQLADLWASAQRQAVQPLAEAQAQQPEAEPSQEPEAPIAAAASSMALANPAQGQDYRAFARTAAQAHGLDPDIFERQIDQESGFNPGALSPAGAAGIAQFMPATAQGMGINPYEPREALDGAARLMASHLDRYGGDYRKALAAYNAGPGAVDRYGDVPPYAETQRYVQNILGAPARPGSPIATAQDLQQAVPLASALPSAPSWFDQARQGFTPDAGALSGLPRMPQPGEPPMRQFGSLGEALAAAAQEATNRRKPLLGPGGLGMYDPNLGPPGESGSEAEQRAGVATLEDVGRAFGEGVPTEAASMAAETGGRVAGGVGQATEAASGIAKTVTGLPDATKRAINELLYPARNTPQQVQNLLWEWSGRKLQGAAEGETWQLQADRLLGKTGGAEAANRFEQSLQFAEHPTSEQEAFAARWKAFADQSGQTGRDLGYVHGDVTQPPPSEGVPVDRPIKVGDTVVHQDGRRLTVMDAAEPGVLHVRDVQAAARTRGFDVSRANVSLPPAPDLKASQAESAQGMGVLDRAKAGEQIPGDILRATLQAEYGTPKGWVPHIWQDQLREAERTASSAGLNPKDFYSYERVFPTYQAGQDFGHTPVDNLGTILRMGAERLHDSEADARFIQGLKDLGPEYIQQLPEAGTRLPQNWVMGKGQFQGYMFPESIGRVLENVTSPSEFRKSALVRAGMDALALGKQSLFPLSGFHFVTELRQSYRANGADGLPAIGKALQFYANPEAYNAWRAQEDTAALFSSAARGGVTGLTKLPPPDVGPVPGGGLGPMAARAGLGAAAGAAYGWSSGKAMGADDQEALQRGLLGAGLGAVGAPLGKVLSDGLWERAVPTLKAMTWHIQQEAGLPARQAAKFVNDTFGGQNLEAIGRSRTVQDALRLMVLAPDWWESWANRLGGAVAGGPKGGASRAFWLRTALVDGAFGLEGLNYALNGHLTDKNDPDHRFDLETTGLYDRMGWDRTDPRTGEVERKYIDVLGPLKAMLNAPGNPVNFARGRLGLVPSFAVEAITNKDMQGNPITQPGENPLRAGGEYAAAALSRVAPIGATTLEQTSQRGEPLPMSIFSAASGMRTASETGAQAANRAARDLFLQRWPDVYDAVRMSQAYKSALPARQTQMITQAQEQTLAQAKVDAQAPSANTGRGAKYPDQAVWAARWGISPEAAERRMDSLVQHYEDYRASLKTSKPLPMPDEQTMTIGRHYSRPGRTSSEYRQRGREQRTDLLQVTR